RAPAAGQRLPGKTGPPGAWESPRTSPPPRVTEKPARAKDGTRPPGGRLPPRVARRVEPMRGRGSRPSRSPFQRGWQRGQKALVRPPSSIFSIVVPQRGQGEPARP